MAKVTPPTFIDGTTVAGEDVFDSIYTLSTDALNGKIETVNLKDLGDRTVGHTFLQKKSSSGGGMTAGTANLDYFTHQVIRHSSDSSQTSTSGIYRGADNMGNADANDFIAIPGASIQFYLPFRAYVLLTWQITWTCDAAMEFTNSSHPVGDRTGRRDGCHVRLFIDNEKGVNLDCNVRRVRETMFQVADDSGTGQEANVYLRDRYKGRYWSGHKWVGAPMSKGFHSASLRVIQTPGTPQVRVRARSMKYIYFKAQSPT